MAVFQALEAVPAWQAMRLFWVASQMNGYYMCLM